MSKRTAEDDLGGAPLKIGAQMETDGGDHDSEMGDFEDGFEDDLSDDEIIEAGVDGRPDAEREAEEKAAAAAAAAAGGAMDVDGSSAGGAAGGPAGGPGTFIVGRTKLEPDQVLAPDPSAYDMLHSLRTPWPCLSFDVVRDQLGDERKAYPATMYTVAGTQAQTSRAHENELMVLKFSGLGKMVQDDDDSDSESEDEEEGAGASGGGTGNAGAGGKPLLEAKSIPLNSTTNRVRTHQVASADPSRPPTTLAATMTESANVYVHDITPHLLALDAGSGAGAGAAAATITPQQNKPVTTIRAHKAEGYAVDWSPLHAAGRLVTGDNDGLIYATTRSDAGGFATDMRAFRGHTGSVEELQWSPSEAPVFASASSDGTVRVWDVRSKSRAPALTMTVSATDVNVMSWSPLTTHLLATGADDGVWAVWDLRQWKPSAAASAATTTTSTTTNASKSTPIASFDYHKEQITSVEWHPTDDSIVAVAAGDSTVTLWDLAVELDDEESRDTAGVQDVPPQLLFVHYHANAKEVHWHPQLPGVLVATGDEFSVFKTISV